MVHLAFRNGKCNLYDFGSSVSLVIRWGSLKGAQRGRVVDDLVSLTEPRSHFS